MTWAPQVRGSFFAFRLLTYGGLGICRAHGSRTNRGVIHMKLEATHLGGRRWAVRPEGQLGTCGWHPVSWDVIYVEAGTAAEAIRKVLAKRGK